MSPLFFSLILLSLFSTTLISATVQHPQHAVQEVERSLNESRRNLGFLSCGTGNPIDDCWRCDPNWEKNRQRLADCAIGFGKGAVGGRDGKIYVVTDSGDDDAVTPKPGTLRMPRCRHGYFHVVNNDYTHWEMYAIGGSANPTINSQGNRFLAPDRRFSKEVTKHEDAPENEWKNWNWRSEGDLMLNGAFFVASGAGASSSYSRASSLGARPSSVVSILTTNAGALVCRKDSRC
ncbi:hypothetical protein L1987_80075 [Smallanthus sonchifolius]|uniref:Uncharacterized protein n=1 Tax=Smallanthus sonchifolius TaxID=185202 RepID=A0ACB8YKY5_9ASTR|nr:hypothetical protein L1987_80075 [Smallanthus sonchifolius]